MPMMQQQVPQAGNPMPGMPPQGMQQQPPKQGGKSSTPKKTGEKDNSDREHPDDKLREKDVVRKWQGRVKAAREKQKDVFKEMRDSMSFAAGMQWPGQRTRKDNRYVANWTLREVNSKVAQLYAKNPKATFERRPRLDFALYNGELESLVPILQSASVSPDGLLGLPIEQRAMLADYEHGMQQRKMLERQGKTLETLFQYQLDEQDEEEGEFKLQFKQMIRRTITAKVGYIRVSFVRDEDALITSSGPGNTIANRALHIKQIGEKVEKGEIKRSDKQMEDLQNLAIGLGGTMQDKQDNFGINERLVYDCLPSTSVLIDPRTKSLKGFIGAKWVGIQYCLLVTDVNAIFEANVKTNRPAQASSISAGEAQNPKAKSHEKGEETVLVYEILDKETRTHFYIADGYECYLAEPEYLQPAVRGFWPLYALTFNDVEADVDAGQTPFPPSDVELLMDAQREFNRCRNEMKKHRKMNRPRLVINNGLLSEEDKENIGNSETADVIELKNPLAQGAKMGDVMSAMPQIPIQGEVYDTTPQLQDAQLTTGNPQEALGDTGGKTATGQTIDQQNRLTVTASNVDDVDDCLTWLARVSSEMMIQGFSPTTVLRLVGPGAVWPQLPDDKANLLAQVTLVTKAASSGRPNQAQNMRNWQIAAPLLMQSGANPQAMVRKTLEVLDSNIDPEEFFPLNMPQTGGQAQGNQSPQGGEHQPSPQESHQPGHTAPPQQGRPGPSKQQSHPQHQPSASQVLN